MVKVGEGFAAGHMMCTGMGIQKTQEACKRMESMQKQRTDSMDKDTVA